MYKKHAVSFAILGLAFALTFQPAELLSDDKPNLTGTWKLNRDESDDFREKMREQMQNRRQRGGGGRGGSVPGGRGGGWPGGGGGGRGGSPPGGGGRQPQGDRDGRRGRLIFDYLRPAESLMIRHDEPELFITKDEQVIHERFTDGRKQEREAVDGTTIQVKTRWKKHKVVTEIKTENTGKITETYELEPEKNRLRLTVRIENSRMGDLEVQYLYDAVAVSPEPKSEKNEETSN